MRPVMKDAYQLVRPNDLVTTTFVGGVPRATKSSSDDPFSSDDEKCEHENANLNEQERYE